MSEGDTEMERKFTDADIRRGIEIFFEIVQQEVGKGIMKGLWAAFVGLIVGATAVGLAVKFNLFKP